MQIQDTIHQTLHQLESILHQLTDQEYTEEIAVLNFASIGKHVRHVIEFFQCLVNADEVISYDERLRELKIETSTTFTIQVIQDLKQRLSHLQPTHTVILKQLVADDILLVPSTIGREIIYCIDHSIHHFALIKIGLKTKFPHISISSDFGIAYSTLKFQAQS